MKKLVLGVILGILLIGLVGVFAEENNTCNSNDDCELKDKPYCCGNDTQYYKSCYHLNETPQEVNCTSSSPCPGIAQINTCKCVNNTCKGSFVSNDTDEKENETEIQRCLRITNKTLCEAKKNCEWNNVTGKCVKITKIKKLKETLQAYLNSTECPEKCTCAGSTIKCETENGRVMTVVAGKSGNIIIQTKGVNASTTVILIKNASGVWGNFSGKIKRIKFLPDEIKEKVLKKLKMENCTDCNITLKDDGSYEMNVERTYRIIWIFPRKIVEVTKVDSETGEIIIIKRPWWRFLAAKNKE